MYCCVFFQDFANTIPGHGGIMDRFDCQYLMATFVNVYIASFISFCLTWLRAERLTRLRAERLTWLRAERLTWQCFYSSASRSVEREGQGHHSPPLKTEPQRDPRQTNILLCILTISSSPEYRAAAQRQPPPPYRQVAKTRGDQAVRPHVQHHFCYPPKQAGQQTFYGSAHASQHKHSETANRSHLAPQMPTAWKPPQAEAHRSHSTTSEIVAQNHMYPINWQRGTHADRHNSPHQLTIQHYRIKPISMPLISTKSPVSVPDEKGNTDSTINEYLAAVSRNTLIGTHLSPPTTDTTASVMNGSKPEPTSKSAQTSFLSGTMPDPTPNGFLTKMAEQHMAGACDEKRDFPSGSSNGH
ncbi:hypothetical protein NQZ68_040541 [Dissostichus eleginoides]|nr:hypothetical protein NQZ68_040541 [Dissostichus eleginoides]